MGEIMISVTEHVIFKLLFYTRYVSKQDVYRLIVEEFPTKSRVVTVSSPYVLEEEFNTVINFLTQINCLTKIREKYRLKEKCLNIILELLSTEKQSMDKTYIKLIDPVLEQYIRTKQTNQQRKHKH